MCWKELENHEIDMHIKFDCKKCEYEAFGRKDLNQHMSSKHGIQERNCWVCDDKDVTKSTFTMHKIYKCKRCYKILWNQTFSRETQEKEILWIIYNI